MTVLQESGLWEIYEEATVPPPSCSFYNDDFNGCRDCEAVGFPTYQGAGEKAVGIWLIIIIITLNASLIVGSHWLIAKVWEKLILITFAISSLA